MIFHSPHIPIKILLADDNSDDRFFFEKALKNLPGYTQLTTVHNGDSVMDFISRNPEGLPDVIFLDLNMPGKSGSECLFAIKKDEQLKALPVIIYSTSLHNEILELLYSEGAHYYLSKPGLQELKSILHYVLTLMRETSFVQPARNKFVLNDNVPDFIM